MNEVTDNTKVNALMLEVLEQLRAENAELKKRCLMAESGASNAISRLNKALSCNEADNMALAEKVREACADKIRKDWNAYVAFEYRISSDPDLLSGEETIDASEKTIRNLDLTAIASVYGEEVEVDG